MQSNTLLAAASMVLALALATPTLADQHIKPLPGHRGQTEHNHAPPPAIQQDGIPRGDLRGDIASNARGRNGFSRPHEPASHR